MPNFKARTATEFIVIHCSATGPNQDIGAADIDRWHRAKGWNGIGYHFVIRRDGRVEAGRPEDAIGAHVEGFNEKSIGICMVGGVDANDINKARDNFTSHQNFTLRQLIGTLKAKYPTAKVQGHRDFPGVKKACPSFDVATFLKQAGL